MKIFGLTLQEWASTLTIATILGASMGGIVVFWIRRQLAADFCSKADADGIRSSVATVQAAMTKLDERVNHLERTVAELPTAEDVRNVRHDVKLVLQTQAALGAKVDGHADMIRGMEGRVTLMLEQLLADARK